MGMHEYLKSLSDLEMINRAPGYFKFEEHNVAAHSFKVTQAAQMLGDIEEQAGNEIDWRSLYEKALNHDYTERFIGDIKTPVKYATPELRSMLARVDKSLTDIYKSSLTAIMDFRDMASVQYFLKKILPELLKDNADGNAKNQLAIITTQIIQQ